MIFVGGVLGRAIALALLGHDMDQHRPFVGVADILEDLDQRFDIMAVDRADIIEAELLEQRAAGRPSRGNIPPSCGPCRAAAPALPRELLRAAGAGPDICARRPAGRDSRDRPPTGGAIDMSLSLRMTTSRLPAAWALFIAS